jgi:hypothetical protein
VKLTKDGQADVDAEVSTTATLQKDTDGRKDDGKQNFLRIGQYSTDNAWQGCS